jgi:hypothetical protein
MCGVMVGSVGAVGFQLFAIRWTVSTGYSPSKCKQSAVTEVIGGIRGDFADQVENRLKEKAG